MSFLSSKWGITIFLIIAVPVILFFTGRKSVDARIEIPATRENVWGILTDFSTSKEWNTVLIPVDGELAPGNTIKYDFFQEENGTATTMDAQVITVDTPELINQTGGMPGILSFDHKYILEQNGDVTTVRIHEEYRGIMVNFWDPAPVEKAYNRLLVALKERAQ